MKKFREIIEEYRTKAFSERDKGNRFEKLMQGFIKTYPVYRGQFTEVWLWNEFPFRKDFGGKDIGIDLVAKTNEGDYWAIQCKCYKEDALINKPAVDSFLSTSSRTFVDEQGHTRSFVQRLWISTTNKWNSEAENTIKNQNPPVAKISLSDLENAEVDWEKLNDGIFGEQAIRKERAPRDHQKKAMSAAHEYFADHDRGKMVMACGTGKTFTSLKVAEQETDGQGLVLFLVPSIALLGQTLNEWCTFAEKPINAICVCSDAGASQGRQGDNDELKTVDLALPATTDVDKIKSRIREAHYSSSKNNEAGMTVIFSTYQSIDVVCKAQKMLLATSAPEEKEKYIFDLIICDEAHRTTGVEEPGRSESPFLMVHKNENVQARHRLYMTATPRLYTADSKKKAAEGNVVICSMDDESIYGEEFFRIGFGEAVEKDLLADYKVLVLTIGDDQIPASLQSVIANPNEQIQTDDASKLIGCINALSKRMVGDEDYLREVDPQPMHTALAFCSRISDSKHISNVLNSYTDVYYNSLSDEVREQMVNVSSRHVDGGMGAAQRDESLSWLKDTPRDGMDCRVITNVRCLSEGVDVPALDAVLFLSARKSQVDVVQSVGRVMRVAHASGKKYGYIIIPVIVPINKTPEEALDDDKNFDVVWSVLNALRAHDDRFNAEVNKIELNKGKSKRIIVGHVGDPEHDPKEGGGSGGRVAEEEAPYQMTLYFEELQGAIYARMVKRVGSRRYWEQWAKDIADIAARHKERIQNLVATDEKHQKAFQKFMKGLHTHLNPYIKDEDAIEMLAQHIITKPVFEALFENYSFVEKNSVSRAMQKMLSLLDDDGLDKDQAQMEKFYQSVRERCEGVDNAEGKQKIIVELYDKFFKNALPKTVGKLGIVYTPVEVVDFIIHSVSDVLKKEFGRNISDENIHVLDPFTGTGTFITRLLQSGLIKEKDLIRKYTKELHANEIVLLAYYIASINIENAFHDLMQSDDYTGFDGICLTDTFQLGEMDEDDIGKLFSDVFPYNSTRLLNQQNTPIRIILGNPPYSVGQTSANDNAQNESYPKLEKRLADTYVAGTKATNKNAIYDSYIKAFRWASDRLDKDHGGIIGFVSNAGWLDGAAMDGMRSCLQEEFDSIYVFNLRGNARTQGETRRREAGNVFGGGSRTPVAITILVKNPKQAKEKADIFYVDIGDYLSREDKLSIISDYKSCMNRKFSDAITVLKPNEYNDWLNQRNSEFENFIPIQANKKFDSTSKSIFVTYSMGLSTSRDSWVIGFSKDSIDNNAKIMIENYSNMLSKIKNITGDISDYIDTDAKKISWSSSLTNLFKRKKEIKYEEDTIRLHSYRPFTKNQIYWGEYLIHRRSLMDSLFPTKSHDNLIICCSVAGNNSEISVLITNIFADWHFNGDTQCFPLYYYEEAETQQGTLFDSNNGEKYIRHDGITDFIFNQARKLYGNKVTKEDIFYYVYGFLHLPKYRTEFAADLKKSLPRIMLVKTPKVFWQISKAGRDLAEIHLNYEHQTPPDEVVVEGAESGNYQVSKLKFKSKEDHSTLIYNKDIVIKNIPESAHSYVVNGRTPLEWIIDRYQVKVDKASGILNDPNKWGEEHNNPRYILDLILSCITVSIKTQEIVDSLPDVNFAE